MRSKAQAHHRIDPEGLKWLGRRAKLGTNEQIARAAGVDVSSVSRGINDACGIDVFSGLMHIATNTGVKPGTAYERLFRLVTDEPRRRDRVGATQ